MKCQCGTAFCWLCGKAIDDTVFPAHFQWWNPAGCSNLQMNEDIVPSIWARIFARVLALGQLVLLGPITVASTLATCLLCSCCVYARISESTKSGSPPRAHIPPLPLYLLSISVGVTYIVTRVGKMWDAFSGLMSCWGLIWMLVLCIFPVALVAGSTVGAFGLAIFVIIYPCYAVAR